MRHTDTLKQTIHEAFADVEAPPEWCLVRSREDEEASLLEAEFRPVLHQHWFELPHGFLDRAPAGYGSALSFFSDEAFRFYLPAYPTAAVEGHLQQAEPTFHLTNRLYPPINLTPVNPRRYGARTWLDSAAYRHSLFTRAQCVAIIAFLRWVAQSLETSPDQRQQIQDAIAGYWSTRAA